MKAPRVILILFAIVLIANYIQCYTGKELDSASQLQADLVNGKLNKTLNCNENICRECYMTASGKRICSFVFGN